MMTIFLESTKGNQAKDTRQALKFIEEQIAQSKTRLEATEAALKDFKIKHFNVMPNLAQDNLVRVAEAQRERQQARLELNQAVDARNAIQRRLANVSPSFSSADPGAASERGVASETETRLRAARSRLDEYLTRFTDAHPDVTNGRRVVRDLEKQLELERAAIRSGTRPANVTVIPNRLYEELSVSLSDADAKVASLTARVADADRAVEVARELSKTVPKVEAEYLQLNRDYAANKASYEVLIARRSSAQMAEEHGRDLRGSRIPRDRPPDGVAEAGLAQSALSPAGDAVRVAGRGRRGGLSCRPDGAVLLRHGYAARRLRCARGWPGLRRRFEEDALGQSPDRRRLLACHRRLRHGLHVRHRLLRLRPLSRDRPGVAAPAPTVC